MPPSSKVWMQSSQRRFHKRTADYGEHVWETLRPQLIPYQKKRTELAGLDAVESSGTRGQLRDAIGGGISRRTVLGEDHD